MYDLNALPPDAGEIIAATTTEWPTPASVAVPAVGEDEDAVLRTFTPAFEYPAGYSMTPDGLYYTDISTGKPKVKRLTLIPFEIVARIADEHSEQPGTLIRWNDEAGIAHEYIALDEMAHTEGSALAVALAKLNLRIRAGAANGLRTFFSLLTSRSRSTTYNRSGWQRGGTLFILPNGLTFGPKTGESIFLRANRNLFQTKGTLADWQREVAPLAVGNSRLMLALSLAFVGPLLDVTGEGFAGFHFVGSSSTGKSTALYLSSSVWGARARDQVRSWRATDNGLEAWTSETSDLALYLDEMGQANPHDLANMVYMLGNGAGKGRMSKDAAGREVRYARCNVISTGELTIESAQKSVRKETPGGLDVRLVNIPADAGAGMGMFENLHGIEVPAKFADHLRDLTAQNYGTAGRAFLEQVATLRAESPDDLLGFVGQNMASFATNHMPKGKISGQVARVVGKFGLAAAAGELAILMDILPFAPGMAEAAAATCLTAWLDERGGVADKEETDILAKLRVYITEHGNSRFEDKLSSEIGLRDRAGWFENVLDVKGALPPNDQREMIFHFQGDVFTKIIAPKKPNEVVALLEAAGFLIGKGRRRISLTGSSLRPMVYSISDRILGSG
jgi:putative DNA primase/helicase